MDAALGVAALGVAGRVLQGGLDPRRPFLVDAPLRLVLVLSGLLLAGLRLAQFGRSRRRKTLFSIFFFNTLIRRTLLAGGSGTFCPVGLVKSVRWLGLFLAAGTHGTLFAGGPLFGVVRIADSIQGGAQGREVVNAVGVLPKVVERVSDLDQALRLDGFYPLPDGALGLAEKLSQP